MDMQGLGGIKRMTTGVPAGGWGAVGGLVQAGNTNLYNRQNVPNNWVNPAGTDIMPKPSMGGRSTVRSMSYQPDEGGPEVLIPTVADGRFMSDAEAQDRYQRTGEHMGKFVDPDAADAYAQQYHNGAEAGKYNSPRGLSLIRPPALGGR